MKLLIYRKERRITVAGHTTVTRGQWYWRLVARNGKTVADGAEGYQRRAACMRMAMKATRALTFEIVDGSKGIVDVGYCWVPK